MVEKCDPLLELALSLHLKEGLGEADASNFELVLPEGLEDEGDILVVLRVILCIYWDLYRILPSRQYEDVEEAGGLLNVNTELGLVHVLLHGWIKVHIVHRYVQFQLFSAGSCLSSRLIRVHFWSRRNIPINLILT